MKEKRITYLNESEIFSSNTVRADTSVKKVPLEIIVFVRADLLSGSCRFNGIFWGKSDSSILGAIKTAFKETWEKLRTFASVMISTLVVSILERK